MDAYRHGIFPWPMPGHPLAWWSPDPRAILEFDRLYVSKRLARTCRSGQFEVTCDRDFAGVVHGCATAQDRRYATWITRPLAAAYQRLHELGHAHSVEAWQDGQLVGGTYGIAVGALFAGESMFHYVRDASKVAIVHLVAHLRQRGYRMMDIQQLTPHMASLGAQAVSRDEYLARLAEAVVQPVTFGEALENGPRS